MQRTRWVGRSRLPRWRSSSRVGGCPVDKRTFVRLSRPHECARGGGPSSGTAVDTRRHPRRGRALLRGARLRRRLDARDRRRGGPAQPGEPLPPLHRQARALRSGARARGGAHRRAHGREPRRLARSRGRRAPAPLPEGRRHAAARRGTRRTEARMRLADIDLSNPDLFAAGPPHEAFRVLRREAPLFWNGNGGSDGFWALTRYRDIWNVSLDPKTFSNARRGTILRDWNEEEAASNATIMLNMDPPRHTKYRRLVNLGFSPKITNRLEHRMREITNRIIDKIAARGECDFVTDVAAE